MIIIVMVTMKMLITIMMTTMMVIILLFDSDSVSTHLCPSRFPMRPVLRWIFVAADNISTFVAADNIHNSTFGGLIIFLLWLLDNILL